MPPKKRRRAHLALALEELNEDRPGTSVIQQQAQSCRSSLESEVTKISRPIEGITETQTLSIPTPSSSVPEGAQHVAEALGTKGYILLLQSLRVVPASFQSLHTLPVHRKHFEHDLEDKDYLT